MEKDEKEKVEKAEETSEEVKETPAEETPEVVNEQNNPEEKISYRDRANKLYLDKNGMEAREEIITDEMLKGQDLNMIILIATGIVVSLVLCYAIFGNSSVVKRIFNKQTTQEEEQKEVIDSNYEYGVMVNKDIIALKSPEIVKDSCTTAEVDAITWNYCLDIDGNAINVYAMNDMFDEVEIPSSFDGHKVISVGMYNSNRQLGLCYAKANCTKVTSVTVPEGVLYVERYFLANASGVTKVKLANSIISIGDYAFYDSPNIMSINSDEIGTFNMPEDLEYYGTNLFEYNKYVTNFSFPERINYINSYTFDKCNTFRKLVIPGQYEYILPGAFSNNDRLTSVTFEDGVLQIAGFANDTSLKEVYISDSVKYIYTKTFSNDGNITKFEYEDKLLYLGPNIFGDAKLDINDFIALKNLNLAQMEDDKKNYADRKEREKLEAEAAERDRLRKEAEEKIKREEEDPYIDPDYNPDVDPEPELD